MRDRGQRVLPFKPVAETSLCDRLPAHSDSLLHQCFAAGAQVIPAMSPVKVVRGRQKAMVWLYDEMVGEVPTIGRDMPVLAKLPASSQSAVSSAINECRLELIESSDVLVSEGSGSATALTELGLQDDANIITAARADQVLLVARASNGLAFTAFDRAIDVLRNEGVTISGLILNDVPGCYDEHDAAARFAVARKQVGYAGVIPSTSFFDNRPKYEPPSRGCDEDHAHLTELVASVLSFGDSVH